MKILHIINSLAIGGAEVLLINVVEELESRGHDVTVVCLEDGHPIMESKAQLKRVVWDTLRNRRYLSVLEFIGYLKKNGPYDVCHTHLFPALFYGCLAKKLGHCQVLIHSEHNTTNNRRKWWFRPLDFAMYRTVDGVVAISEAVARTLKNWLPSAQNKVETIFNCIEFSARKETYEKSNRLRLVSVGRLVTDKNLSLQLEALALLKDVYIDHYGEGPLLEELQRLAQKLGINGRITYCGPSANLPNLYKEYDALVHSATLEGFGLAVAEAMSAGLPVIVGNVPGVAEVMGNSGIHFDPNSSRDLAQKISWFATLSEEQRASLGDRLVQSSQRFSIQTYVSSLLQAYGRKQLSFNHRS